MKFALLLLSMLSLTITNAQSFSVETTDTTFTGLAIQYDFGGYIDLLNLSNEELELKWKRTENNLPEGWECSICDPTSCKPPEADSSSFTLPISGVTNHINIHFYPNGVEGIGTTKIKVEDPNNSDVFYLLSFTGDTRTIGVDEIESLSISLYPNPVKDLLHVQSSKECNMELRIYDLRGSLVYSETSNSSFTADLSHFKSGLYMVELISDQDYFTESILVQ